jgi:hypothetical protein
MPVALWDGKNLAAIQMATRRVKREHGRPAAEVDESWNLTINGDPVAVGSFIMTNDDDPDEVAIAVPVKCAMCGRLAGSPDLPCKYCGDIETCGEAFGQNY